MIHFLIDTIGFTGVLIIQNILPTQSPRQVPIPISIKRYDRHSSYDDVRMDDGFPKELDKEVIHGFGNAVVPIIPFEIFKAIQQYEDTNN